MPLHNLLLKLLSQTLHFLVSFELNPIREYLLHEPMIPRLYRGFDIVCIGKCGENAFIDVPSHIKRLSARKKFSG